MLAGEHPQEAVRKDYAIYQRYIKSVKTWNTGLRLRNT